MHAREVKLVRFLESTIDDIKKQYSWSENEDLLNKSLIHVFAKPLGEMSKAFIKQSVLSTYLALNNDSVKNICIQLRLLLENQYQQPISETFIRQLSELLIKRKQSKKWDHFVADQLYSYSMDGLYASRDDRLVEAVTQSMLIMKAAIFNEAPIPERVAPKEVAKHLVMRSFFQRNNHHTREKIENHVVTLQRHIRRQLKYREDVVRIPALWNVDVSVAKQWMRQGSKPYMPKCDIALAARIMDMAHRITLFSTVGHITAKKSLASIFDQGLYGRRNLLDKRIAFEPGVLDQDDIHRGDGNAICLGPNFIHNGVESVRVKITFNLDKLDLSNPCVYYKQQDFGFLLEGIRHIKIGSKDFYFSHTDETTYAMNSSKTHVVFSLFNDGRHYDEHNRYGKFESSYGMFANIFRVSRLRENTQSFTLIPMPLLISNNTQQMHAILILNFFRFIDNLIDLKNREERHPSQAFIDALYSEIATLDDQALKDTLQAIGEQLTDTMEFNLYGAHRIDFDSIEKIVVMDEEIKFRFDLPDFIAQLIAGDRQRLLETQRQLPEIFKSYRFLDYLLTKPIHPVIASQLREDRKMIAELKQGSQTISYAQR